MPKKAAGVVEKAIKAKTERNTKKAPVPEPVQEPTPAKAFGWMREADVPWCAKKVTLIRHLKKTKAFEPGKAQTVKEIATVTGLSEQDVRHYAYHARAGGLIEIDRAMPKRFKFYLTAKGKECDPGKEFKEQMKDFIN